MSDRAKTMLVIAQLLFWASLCAWFQKGAAVQVLVFVTVLIGGGVGYIVSKKYFGAGVERQRAVFFPRFKGIK